MISEEEVLAEAVGVLGTWLGKWTEPEDENAPQRRIRIEQHFDNGCIVRVEGAPYSGEPDKRFEIIVGVRSLT